MSETVKAAVKVAVEKTEIQEFERPVVPVDAALLRVEASGVGGSDPELYRKVNHAPIIMGHENVGTIDEIGAEAAMRWNVRVGDRVSLHEYLPCWRCEWCLRGDFRLCLEVDFFNVKDRLNTLRFGMSACTIPPHLWGGFAQYMYMPINTVLHRIPADLPAAHATLMVPFGNGVQWAVTDGGAGPGKTVLIFGPGQQGLGCVVAAKEAGARTIILAGLTRDRSRLKLALRLGADEAIDVEEVDLKKRVMGITGGRGVDVVVDTTSDPTGEIMETSVTLAAKGATLNLNGLGQSISIGEIKRRYLTVRAPRGRSYQAAETALRYIASGKYSIDEVCSHSFGLGDVDAAIKASGGKQVAGAVHVTVDPWAHAQGCD